MIPWWKILSSFNWKKKTIEVSNEGELTIKYSPEMYFKLACMILYGTEQFKGHGNEQDKKHIVVIKIYK